MPMSPHTKERLHAEWVKAKLDKWSPADYGEGAAQAALLNVSLAAAVPLWIMEYRSLGEIDWELMLEDAREVVEIISGPGSESLVMGCRTKKGKAATAFNALAKGLAIMSFCPGGVTFLGNHWETKQGRT